MPTKRSTPKRVPTAKSKKPAGKIAAAKVPARSAKPDKSAGVKGTPKRRPAPQARAASTELMKKYRSHKQDTGSTDVQVIHVTERITELVNHLTRHRTDNDSRRGLLVMVGKRRRLLNYLKRQDEKVYTKLIGDLGLRK